MRYELLMTDGDISDDIRSSMAADLIFPPELHVPLTRDTADFLAWFYRGGTERAESTDGGDEYFLETRLPYRFDTDYPFIYSAFKELYGIDLDSVEYLHWWQFRAMFRSLHDCKFSEIVGYRTADTSEMSEKMREYYIKMQEAYELPVSLTTRRQIAAAQRFLNS